MRSRVLVIGSLVGSILVLALGSVTAGAWAAHSVTVDGAVAKPATYDLAALSAMEQTAVRVSEPRGSKGGSHTERGVLLEDLANLSQPQLPRAKNALLRVALTVRGDNGRGVTFALGELDANFGNHPAVLSIWEDGVPLRTPKLVVAGDTAPARFVDRVERITVGVENPVRTTPPAGGLDVLGGRRTISLSSELLHALPARTLSVSFVAGTGAQRHTEEGPTLRAVLAAAHIQPSPDTWVAAVGSDGYVALVTPAEAVYGGKTLLISTVEDGVALAQPRLVVDGDIKGGRYVSVMVDLVVGPAGRSSRESGTGVAES